MVIAETTDVAEIAELLLSCLQFNCINCRPAFCVVQIYTLIVKPSSAEVKTYWLVGRLRWKDQLVLFSSDGGNWPRVDSMPLSSAMALKKQKTIRFKNSNTTTDLQRASYERVTNGAHTCGRIGARSRSSRQLLHTPPLAGKRTS